MKGARPLCILVLHAWQLSCAWNAAGDVSKESSDAPARPVGIDARTFTNVSDRILSSLIGTDDVKEMPATSVDGYSILDTGLSCKDAGKSDVTVFDCYSRAMTALGIVGASTSGGSWTTFPYGCYRETRNGNVGFNTNSASLGTADSSRQYICYDPATTLSETATTATTSSSTPGLLEGTTSTTSSPRSSATSPAVSSTTISATVFDATSTPSTTETTAATTAMSPGSTNTSVTSSTLTSASTTHTTISSSSTNTRVTSTLTSLSTTYSTMTYSTTTNSTTTKSTTTSTATSTTSTTSTATSSTSSSSTTSATSSTSTVSTTTTSTPTSTSTTSSTTTVSISTSTATSSTSTTSTVTTSTSTSSTITVTSSSSSTTSTTSSTRTSSTSTRSSTTITTTTTSSVTKTATSSTTSSTSLTHTSVTVSATATATSSASSTTATESTTSVTLTATTGSETSTSTTRTKIVLIQGHLQMNIDDSGAFVDDVDARLAVTSVVAGLFAAPEENTSIVMSQTRRLAPSLRRLEFGLVDIWYTCVLPEAPWDTNVAVIESRFDSVTRSEVRNLMVQALAEKVGLNTYMVDVAFLPDCTAEVVEPWQLTSTSSAVLGSQDGQPRVEPRSSWPVVGVASGSALVFCALGGSCWLAWRRRRGLSKKRSANIEKQAAGTWSRAATSKTLRWTLEQLAEEVVQDPGKPLESLVMLQTLLCEYRLVQPWPAHKQGGQSIIASAVHRGSLESRLLKISTSASVEKERMVAARLRRIGQNLQRESKITQDARFFVAGLKDSRLNPDDSEYPFGLLSLDEGSGTLNDVLKSASAGAITNDMKRPVLSNCAGVVAFLHECGIGWGDCAPSNFVAFKVTSLMGDLFQYRAIDFGSAALLPDVEGSGDEELHLARYYSPDDAVQVGFCAPERLCAIHNRQRIPATDSMDIWALGCIAFFVLAGRPLMGDTEEECAANLLVSQGQGLNVEFMVRPDLQEYVEERLDDFSKRMPLRALTELRKMLSVDPACRPTAAQLIAGSYFGMDKSISMSRSIIRRFDDIQATMEKFDPPVPDIVRVEVSPKNMARQTVSLVFGCADGDEFKAEVSDWRWWFRVAQQMSSAGKAVFCLIGGDLSGVDSVASMATSAQTWAETSCTSCFECLTGGGNKMTEIQEFHSAFHGRNIMDAHTDAESGTQAMRSLFQTWKQPGDTTSFDDLMSQCVKISTQTDRVKLVLRQSGFYDKFYYDVRRQGGGAWVSKDSNFFLPGRSAVSWDDGATTGALSAPSFPRSVASGNARGTRARANTSDVTTSPMSVSARFQQRALTQPGFARGCSEGQGEESGLRDGASAQSLPAGGRLAQPLRGISLQDVRLEEESFEDRAAWNKPPREQWSREQFARRPISRPSPRYGAYNPSRRRLVFEEPDKAEGALDQDDMRLHRGRPTGAE